MHLIALSLSPYSLQQQCCGFYVVARGAGTSTRGTSSTGGGGAAVYFIETIEKTDMLIRSSLRSKL